MNTSTKPANHAGRHLSPPELRSLLADDEASASFRAAAAHLENCDTCQAELTVLAGDASWWEDTEQFLSGDSEPRWKPDESQSLVSVSGAPDRQAIDDHISKLLGAPLHPEMLGRLGRYDIEKVLGSGGMGIVLKAHDSELNRPIAIKMLSPHLSHVGAARERFAREGKAAAAVVHEHVVAIYNVEADGAHPFLIMQYVPGRSLQTRVDEDGPLGIEEILRIGLQAAAGLAAAHAQGLVHRDIKPSNILLEESVERAVLTDFGLARAIDDATLTQTGILAGTPSYMSPEQATGGEVDARSDLFSLGAVLYFMATGRPPFRAEGALAVLNRICNEKHRPAWQLNKDLPDQLCDVIDRLLEKKRTRRFATATEVHQRLAALLSQTQLHGLGRRRSRALYNLRRYRNALIAAASLAVLAVVIAGTWHSRAAKPTAETKTAPFVTIRQPVSQIEIDSATERETEFFKSLQETQAALSAAERETGYIRNNNDTWPRDLDALRRDIDRIEQAGR